MIFYPDRLKSIREVNGMSQKDLADAAGITFQAVSQYENRGNKPRPKTVYNLARALGCSVYDISDLKPRPDDPALNEICLLNNIKDPPRHYLEDPLINVILNYVEGLDKHEKADIIKLLGLWSELDKAGKLEVLDRMDIIVRPTSGGAVSA